MRSTNHQLWREIAKEGAVLEECSSGSDRVLAIVGTSVLEGLLDEIIPRYLIADEAEQTVLLGQRGALAGFANKVRLAYLLGMFSEAVFRDVLAIAKVRNHFAHDTAVASFEHVKVRTLCLGLKSPLAFSRIQSDEDWGLVEWSMDTVAGEKKFGLTLAFKQDEIRPSDPRWQFETSVQFVAFLLSGLPTQRPRQPRY